LFFFLTELVHIHSVLHLDALNNRWLVKLLASTNLLDNTSFLSLSLELLESFLDVLTLF
jgi:hypothetical protein